MRRHRDVLLAVTIIAALMLVAAWAESSFLADDSRADRCAHGIETACQTQP